MIVEIGAEVALFPEKEYINGIAVAVHAPRGGTEPLWKGETRGTGFALLVYRPLSS